MIECLEVVGVLLAPHVSVCLNLSEKVGNSSDYVYSTNTESPFLELLMSEIEQNLLSKDVTFGLAVWASCSNSLTMILFIEG